MRHVLSYLCALPVRRNKIDLLRHVRTFYWHRVAGNISPRIETLYKGNGIGLAIVKQVVKLHKGNVSISCADGINCFTVLIPNRQKEVTT